MYSHVLTSSSDSSFRLMTNAASKLIADVRHSLQYQLSNRYMYATTQYECTTRTGTPCTRWQYRVPHYRSRVPVSGTPYSVALSLSHVAHVSRCVRSPERLQVGATGLNPSLQQSKDWVVLLLIGMGIGYRRNRHHSGHTFVWCNPIRHRLGCGGCSSV
jgi:hypothetical protein